MRSSVLKRLTCPPTDVGSVDCALAHLLGEARQDSNRLEEDDSKRTFRIDSKTFDCQAYKRFFLINNKKHAELRAADTYYFCLLSPWHSRKGLVAALVPY